MASQNDIAPPPGLPLRSPSNPPNAEGNRMSSTTSAPAIEIKELSIQAGAKLLLARVNLRIESGEKVVLIGPNGAGKTTLLKAMAGLIPGGEKTVFWNGRPLETTSRREMARILAYVPQLGERLPQCSVSEFVVLARYAHGNRWFGGADNRDRKSALRALQLAGVAGFGDRDLSTLSGGERQRVMIAGALAQEAPVMFLDEPASFLDYRQEFEVRELLDRLHMESGKTLVMVVHDLNQGALESDRIIALLRGKIVFNGTPTELLKDGRLQSVYETGFDVFKHQPGGRTIILPNGQRGVGQ